MFSCEFCEISKNAFPYRTPPVAASEFRKCIIKVIRILSTNTLSKSFWDKMLIGLSFSLRFPEPCLITSVTLAYLEDAGNFDKLIHCMKSVRIQTFIGLYFPDSTTEKKPVLGHFSQWLLRQFEIMFMMIINRIEGEDASESTRLIYSKIVKSLTKIKK